LDGESLKIKPLYFFFTQLKNNFHRGDAVNMEKGFIYGKIQPKCLAATDFKILFL